MSYLEYLDELFPNPKCELNYKKDYEFLIAVCLSAQTTDKKVNLVTDELFKKYDNLNKLASADIDDIKRILKPIGTFNKKAYFVHEISSQLLNKYNGIVPKDHKSLESLPGIGHKTASLVLGTLYAIPEFPVDTHVSRVSKRLGFCNDDDSVEKVEYKMKKLVPKERWIRTHHQLVLFGRYYCRSQKPECDNCKLKKICKRNQ